MAEPAATLRDCPECGKRDEHLMKDGEWICHSCGHVEFPAGRDPAAPWRESSAAYTAEGETLDALRESLLTTMSDWSEENWAAGWMCGTEEMLHEKGGTWEVLGRAVGWPTGYEEDADFRWVTWNEAGAIFAERKAARGC